MRIEDRFSTRVEHENDSYHSRPLNGPLNRVCRQPGSRLAALWTESNRLRASDANLSLYPSLDSKGTRAIYRLASRLTIYAIFGADTFPPSG